MVTYDATNKKITLAADLVSGLISNNVSGLKVVFDDDAGITLHKLTCHKVKVPLSLCDINSLTF